MSAPKSDQAIIESRRTRLLALIAEGNNLTQASEILKREGFPADRDTIWRDARSFNLQNANSSEMDLYRADQLIKLAEIEALAHDPRIKPDRKVDLLLAVLDRDIRLKGTEAPKKSIAVNFDANPENLTGYRKFVQETRQLSAGDLEKVWLLCRRLTAAQTRPAIEAYFPPEEESDETA
jgi:hypothetical protein